MGGLAVGYSCKVIEATLRFGGAWLVLGLPNILFLLGRLFDLGKWKKMSEEKQIQIYLSQGEIGKAEQTIHSAQKLNANMVIINMLIQIFRLETEKNIPNTVFSVSLDMGVLVKRFITVKLLLRRLEFDLPQRYQRELYAYCRKYKVSEYFLTFILWNNIFKRKKVCMQLAEMFPKKAGHFKKVYRRLEEEENG